MKIADLDDSTRRLVYAAKLMAKFPSSQRLRFLQRAASQYDKEHCLEQASNLLRALFGEE